MCWRDSKILFALSQLNSDYIHFFFCRGYFYCFVVFVFHNSNCAILKIQHKIQFEHCSRKVFHPSSVIGVSSDSQINERKTIFFFLELVLEENYVEQ